MTALPLRLSTTDIDFETQLQNRLHVPAEDDAKVVATVAGILKAVQTRGDAALLEYTQRFDQVNATTMVDLTKSPAATQRAFASLSPTDQTALKTAADRIRSYHEAQKQMCGSSWEYTDAYGNKLGQQVTPLDKVGIYVPGGKAAYPSSVLMNAIPARVAGVEFIAMTVPTPRGEINPWVLAAAHVAGVDVVYTIGGAQAVAALAYGTQTVAAVDKIVGPGNCYVAEAKRQVFGKVGIDMIAGPSEILVIADGSVDAHWVAMDLLSQAEHDEMAQSLLLSPNASYLDAVEKALLAILPTLHRTAIASQSIAKRAAFIQTRDLEEACAISNRIAPEHLEVACENPRQVAAKLKHAGAIFLGAYSSESLGDYCAGPNHVLPTSSTARFSSPLGVYDFQKRSSLIEASQEGAIELGRIANQLALAEGLSAHANSAMCRIPKP